MGSSNKKKDKEDKEKSFIEPSALSETDSVTKKVKKHKHKRLKEKSKREKNKSSVATSDLDEDVDMGDSSQLGQDHVDGFLPCYSADSMGTWDEEDTMQMSSVKTKKSKKKDKNKDRDLLKASKKDKKNSKKEGKPDSDGKIERKESRPEKKSTGKDDGTDSEEERWLHAIEAGKLEEVDDELKRIRNPRLLTARQRALLEKQRPGDPTDSAVMLLPGEDVPQQQHQQLLQQQEALDQCPIIIPAEPLLALPSGVREKEVTQEMLEKKAIKSQRRRAQALEKREEDKKKTVDRLLKKQDPKLLKSCFTKKSIKSEVLMFSYRSTREGSLLSLPTGIDYPIEHQQSPPIPKAKLCGITGCPNPKRYSCSKSGVPLCSLQCYNINNARGSMAPRSPAVTTIC